LKKVIAICCFAALLLSTSSLSYFYKLQEKLHEQERFASIDAGKFVLNNTETFESKEHSNEYESEDDINSGDQITLTVIDKSVLPEGYQWEEKGREFSYNGMFYDIVSIEQTKEGWVIKAASDEEEAAIVQHNRSMGDTEEEEGAVRRVEAEADQQEEGRGAGRVPVCFLPAGVDTQGAKGIQTICSSGRQQDVREEGEGQDQH
jgi:hypothetical protein